MFVLCYFPMSDASRVPAVSDLMHKHRTTDQAAGF